MRRTRPVVYDEEYNLFRFREGKFAFSSSHADCEPLRKRSRLQGME